MHKGTHELNLNELDAVVGGAGSGFLDGLRETAAVVGKAENLVIGFGELAVCIALNGGKVPSPK